MNTLITRDFCLEEFQFSAVATIFSLDNTANADAIINLTYLCINVLQPLRDAIGAPVLVNSGYRCKELNKRVGGAENSQHMYGQAADITVIGSYNSIVQAINAQNIVYDQLITYPARNFVHVSYSKTTNRMQRLYN